MAQHVGAIVHRYDSMRTYVWPPQLHHYVTQYSAILQTHMNISCASRITQLTETHHRIQHHAWMHQHANTHSLKHTPCTLLADTWMCGYHRLITSRAELFQLIDCRHICCPTHAQHHHTQKQQPVVCDGKWGNINKAITRVLYVPISRSIMPDIADENVCAQPKPCLCEHNCIHVPHKLCDGHA